MPKLEPLPLIGPHDFLQPNLESSFLCDGNRIVIQVMITTDGAGRSSSSFGNDSNYSLQQYIVRVIHVDSSALPPPLPAADEETLAAVAIGLQATTASMVKNGDESSRRGKKSKKTFSRELH